MIHVQTADGLRLACDDRGQGLPLVCLPGLTRTMADFEPVCDLAGRLRLIRMDYRGRGASDRAADPASYTIAQEAADLLGLLDHLGIARAAILGTSRGGLIAMHLARVAPERLLGAALVDIGPVMEPGALDTIARRLGRPPPWQALAEAAAALPGLMAPAFVDVAPETWAAHARALYRETPQGLALRYDPALAGAFRAWLSAAEPPDWEGFAALAQRPLALIRGANSDLLSPASAAEMQARAPGMIRVDVPGRGHVPFLDEPLARAGLDRWLEHLS